ncbi:GumC family protein [Robiginitalea sp. IMCC43444]|uniref:GumC family protein n=1 Tax=Robiginitalea sp. IMCC43444 TaxID=3459121 RepID=UPI0040412CCB
MKNNKIDGFSFKNIDIGEYIKIYTKRWYWFVIALIITCSLAFLNNRYTIPQYAAQARIKIQQNENSPGIAVLSDLGINQNSENPVQDEIEVIKSRSNFLEVVRTLNLNTQIFAQGDILESEIYFSPPFDFNFIGSDSLNKKAPFGFWITINSDASFSYSLTKDSEKSIYTFGNRIPTPAGELVLTPNNKTIGNAIGKSFRVNISSPIPVADSYRDRILIKPINQSSTILEIYLQDRIQEKAKQIINTLIQVYNSNAIADYKESADKTSNFIDARVTEIYRNLSQVDESQQEYKTERGITNIESQSSMNLSLGVANRQELQNLSLQLNGAKSMLNRVEAQEGFNILPSNLIPADPTINATAISWNQLVARRNGLMESSNEKNPVVANLDRELNILKQGLVSSLKNLIDNLELRVNNLSQQQSRINYQIYSAPEEERALRDINRKRDVTEALYLYLYEKREEAQIAFASSDPPSKVIDWAYSRSSAPVYPVKSQSYLIAIFFGLIIPFGLIYLNDLLDDKVHNKVALEKIVGDIPVLAELPKVNSKESLLVRKEDRSVLAESIRILQTNLDYMLRSKSKKDKRKCHFGYLQRTGGKERLSCLQIWP